jgi:CheY-like chemotaxis protein
MNELIFPDFSGKQILIAEDDTVNYTLLENFINRTKAVIHWAKNGVEAVDISINKPIDLVLMDIRMPEMDGIIASKLIRKYFPDLPIIAQTAYTEEEDIENIMNSGINEYMAKPIDGTNLLNILKKYLKV